MSSPFSSFEEFSSAEGPIYTFANNPAMLTILLVISLLISVYFFYASFHLKSENKPENPAALAVLILAGAASLLGSLLAPQPSRPVEANRDRSEVRAGVQPLALLGLMGIGGTSIGSLKRRSRKARRAASRKVSKRW